MSILQDFGIWLGARSWQIPLAGVLGGVVRSLTLRSSLPDFLVSMVVGGICAVYLNPIAAPLVSFLFDRFVLDPESRAALSGFAIGLAGIGISGFVMDLIKEKLRKKKDSGL